MGLFCSATGQDTRVLGVDGLALVDKRLGCREVFLTAVRQAGTCILGMEIVNSCRPDSLVLSFQSVGIVLIEFGFGNSLYSWRMPTLDSGNRAWKAVATARDMMRTRLLMRRVLWAPIIWRGSVLATSVCCGAGPLASIV